MAASSSSVVPTRRKGGWTYDVFLSFRGEDTRNNFVDHLYEALVQKGIHTFKDDEMLGGGQPISQELLKAIKESRWAVVVFSKHYANSSWCLEELSNIMECHKQMGGQKVLPVFYHVDPSDVRKQNGDFTIAFETHEDKFKGGEMDKVNKWREALTAAASLSGQHILPDHGGEASFINKIVQQISSDIQPRDMRSKIRKLESTATYMKKRKEHNDENTLMVPDRVPSWLEEAQVIIDNEGDSISEGVIERIDRLMEEKSNMEWTNEQIPLGMVSSATPQVPQDVTQNIFGSRKEIFQRALQLLEPGNTTQMVALCGMGGIGKTTMMEELKKVVENRKLFDRVVRVVIGNSTDPIAFQDAITDYVGGGNLSESTRKARADRLKERFLGMSQDGKKKILIILDDLWNMVDLKDIGLASPLPKGFKLFLTSRYEMLCHQMGVETSSILRMVGLEEAEAKQLFWETTGLSDGAGDQELHKLGEDIVMRCGGLPMAIKTIALALTGEIKDAWRVTLLRLRRHDLHDLQGHYDVLYDIFEISYDYLKKVDDKEIFILSGLFPNDFDIPLEDLMRYGWGLKLFNKVYSLAEARHRTNTSVHNLIRANMLVESDRKGCVKMHDLARSFVLYNISKFKQASIVNHSDTSEWPTQDTRESCERIFLKCKGMSEFPQQFDYPDLKLLKLMMNDYEEDPLKFPDGFYTRMKQLQVISYRGIRYPSVVPISLQCSTSLRVLCLRSCSLMDDLSSIGQLSNLEILSFAYCRIKNLPSTVGNLKNLKLLDLTGCDDLRIGDGVFQNLDNLEELYMRPRGSNGKVIRFTGDNCEGLEMVLKKLLALEVEFFKNIIRLDNVSFKKLERFRISIGCHLDSIYDDDDDDDDDDVYSVENTLRLVASCEEVCASEINELFEKTEKLHLQVEDMNHLEDVLMHPSQYSFCNLKHLSFEKCANLKYLFTVNVASTLTNLERLIVKSCPVLGSLIHGENNGAEVIKFHKLKRLVLKELPEFVGLCDNINIVMELPQLVRIILDDLPITCIFASSNNISATTIPLLNKEELSPKLEELEIRGMKNLKEIWACESNGAKGIKFNKLKRLVLEELPRLEGLCDNINIVMELPQLVELRLVRLPNFTCIFASSNNISARRIPLLNKEVVSPKLEELEIRGMKNLKEIWACESNGAEGIKFNKLKRLVLEELPRFEGLCDNINIVMELPQLVRIILDDLPNITCIFASSNNISATTIPLLNKEVVCPKLEILDIQGMKNLKEIWESEEVTEIENFRNIVTPMTIKLGRNNRLVEFIQDKKGLLRAVSKATNHYHDRNIIKDGGSGKVYKGKLSRNGRLMYIAVSRFNRQYRENYIDHFRRELEFLSAFKHDNITSIFEYFDEDGENTIIYKHAFHGNLQGHLRNPALTWSRRLQICLGVARALNYIHNEGRIHCDIKSSKILLDEDWEPRIFGFELCTEFFQSWTHRLHLCRYSDATSVMTPKYDVYLFGLLLFEVLCGKKTKVVDGFNGKLDDIIDPSLSKQIGSPSMQLFTKLAYNCLDKELVERPTMNEIVKELEEALKLQPGEEIIERSTNRDEGALWNRREVEILKIPLSEIMSATNNFEEECLVGSGGFGIVYRAKLNVLDIQSVSSIKGNSKDELPRKRKTVAIKRLMKKVDEQVEKDFSTEIELQSVSKHPNVVSLLGFCREVNERILVFEYASKGTLCDYLIKRKPSLTWSQRIQICLHVAYGINYLHTKMEGKPRIIHRDIKSDNILLDENLNAKVADFGLSRFHLGKSTLHTVNVAGTKVYIDPEYQMTFRYKKETDIYSFGVVLFEVLSGKMAYDDTYLRENDDGLAPIVRKRFNDGTLKELIDPKMLEDDEHTFTLNRGPTEDSYNLFSEVGYKCLAKTQAERPTMEDIIKTLQHALEVQGGTMAISRFQLSSIELATENFDKRYYMELDTYGKAYKAQLDHFESNSLPATEGKNNGEPSKKRISVVIKRISDRKDEHGEKGFFSEIEMHTRYKHPNIVPLLGFCYEGDNMLLVYEHASNGSLDNYLRDTDNMTKYTWIQRLYQCLGIAHGLNHLHNLMDRKQEMIHVDIRSANILLGKSGEVKIAYSGFSKLPPTNQEESTDTTNNNVRTKVYCPEYRETPELKKQSDMYSFGVVLFEIFCGRLAYDPDYIVIKDYGLAPIARQCFNDGTIMEMIDPALKEGTLEDTSTSNREPILDSFDTYLRIANQCLAENQAERPTVQTVIKELEMALNIQGFSLDKLSRKKCYMLAARDLSIAWGDNPRYWRWISLPESRFAEVAELISVSWLQVHGTIDTSLLSIDTRYAAYFVYKSTPNISGFEHYPAEVYIELSGVESQSEGQIKMVYLDPAVHLRIFDRFSMGIQSNAGPPLNGPKSRQDGWLEIELGEFFNEKEEGELKMTMEEVNGRNLKGGIIVQGIEIRPKAS